MMSTKRKLQEVSPSAIETLRRMNLSGIVEMTTILKDFIENKHEQMKAKHISTLTFGQKFMLTCETRVKARETFTDLGMPFVDLPICRPCTCLESPLSDVNEQYKRLSLYTFATTDVVNVDRTQIVQFKLPTHNGKCHQWWFGGAFLLCCKLQGVDIGSLKPNMLRSLAVESGALIMHRASRVDCRATRQSPLIEDHQCAKYIQENEDGLDSYTLQSMALMLGVRLIYTELKVSGPIGSGELRHVSKFDSAEYVDSAGQKTVRLVSANVGHCGRTVCGVVEV